MIIMWNDAKITGYVTSVTWAGSAKQAARTVVFSVAYSPNDKNVKTLNIKLGDKIVFYPGYPDDKKTKFVGIITQRERKSEMGELQYTATDGMIHLLRSSGTYRFANKTPEKIAQMVCRDVKVKTGSIAKTKMPIAKIFFQERPYYEIIMAAYTKAYKKTKKPYIAQMNKDRLEVIEKGKVIPNFHIRQGERITSSTYSESLDNMVNRVYVYNSSNQKIGSISNSKWADKYGIFQNAISVDSGNGSAEAKNELHGIDKTANLTMIGDYRCVSGLGVIIEDFRTGLKGKFWIENDSHQWNSGVYTTTLELAFKNIMDKQEEDEEQETSSSASSSASGTGTSDALNDVLNQARAWIGISGTTNEATQYYGYNGVAWCCIFQWSVFNKSGHGNLFMGGGKTASCINVTQWYQARGKFGKTPKAGALVVYGPGGGSHIGLVESVSGSGINDYVSIEGNTSGATGGLVARKQYGNRRNDVYGFCYIDYPVTTISVGSGTAISGTTVNIPSSVPQTGITGNYTCYPQFYGRWNAGTTQRRISEIWGQKGKTGSPENIATIDGYYLIAVTQKFGQVGDIVCVVLANGTRINCMIADEKNPGDSNYTEWGHDLGGGKADVIEWESMVYGFPNVDKWRGQRVTTIINGGRYKGL
jgi:hypothetical protein|nr:MAG TPA: 43 kDa tail protein [Caudoviricetes sp.]